MKLLQEQHPEWHASLNSRKYFKRWKSSLRPGRSTMTDEVPWLTFKAIDLLESHVNASMTVFEYGGGGSTLFFTSRAGKVVTVEHNAEWFSILQKQCAEKQRNNWEGFHVSAEPGAPSNSSIANPDSYVSDDKDYCDMNFRSYASFIDRYPEESFDIIVVDGRARPSCTKHAIPRLKKGGWLVIDNTDRDYYFDAFREVLTGQFDMVLHEKGPAPYCAWFTQTSIWKKK